VRPAQAGVVRDTRQYLAVLKSRQSIVLRPQVTALIQRYWAKPGQHVAQGQLLLTLNPEEPEAAFARARAAEATARADVQSASKQITGLAAQRQGSQAALTQSRQHYQRTLALAKEEAASLSEQEQATRQLRQDEAGLATIQAQLEAQQAAFNRAQHAVGQARASLQETAARRRHYQITAPFAGVMGDWMFKDGEYVTPLAIVATLTQPGPLEADIQVPKEDIAAFQVGMALEVLNEAQQAVVRGQVQYISPRADESTQTVLVKAQIPNPTHKLLAQEMVPVRFVISEKSGVVVPAPAVMQMQGQDFIFLAVKNSQGQILAKQHPVKLGKLQAGGYPVLAGLKVGEPMIVAGIQKVMDGAPIAPGR
jgi:RND family efflux transporter MFP subunit